MALGALARYFKTPIPFFFDLNSVELDERIEVMNESIRREEEEIKRSQRGK